METPDVSASTVLPAPFRRPAMHRVCWSGPDPEAGDYLLAPGGRSAYRIVEITVLHHNSVLQTPRLRLICWSCSARDVPTGATVHPWARTERVAPSAEQRADIMRSIRLRKAHDARAAIERARAVGSDDGHVAAVRRQAGSVSPVVAGHWDDPDDINERSKQPWQVYGYRRRDGLHDLRKAGIVSEAQWAAAELFRVDFEVTRGARPQMDDVKVDICTSRSYEPPDYLLKATRRVREAWQDAIGIIGSAVVTAVVVGGQPIGEFITEQGWDEDRARDVLIAALDRLATLYSTTDRDRRQGRKAHIAPVHQTPVVVDEAVPAADAPVDPAAPARPHRGVAPSEPPAEPFQPWRAPVITRRALTASVRRLLTEMSERNGLPAG